MSYVDGKGQISIPGIEQPVQVCSDGDKELLNKNTIIKASFYVDTENNYRLRIFVAKEDGVTFKLTNYYYINKYGSVSSVKQVHYDGNMVVMKTTVDREGDEIEHHSAKIQDLRAWQLIILQLEDQETSDDVLEVMYEDLGKVNEQGQVVLSDGSTIKACKTGEFTGKKLDIKIKKDFRGKHIAVCLVNGKATNFYYRSIYSKKAINYLDFRESSEFNDAEFAVICFLVQEKNSFIRGKVEYISNLPLQQINGLLEIPVIGRLKIAQEQPNRKVVTKKEQEPQNVHMVFEEDDNHDIILKCSVGGIVKNVYYTDPVTGEIEHFLSKAHGTYPITDLGELDILSVLQGKKDIQILPERDKRIKIKGRILRSKFRFYKAGIIKTAPIFTGKNLELQLFFNQTKGVVVNCFVDGEENPRGYLWYDTEEKCVQFYFSDEKERETIQSNAEKIINFLDGRAVDLKENIVVENAAAIDSLGCVHWNSRNFLVCRKGTNFGKKVTLTLFKDPVHGVMLMCSVDGKDTNYYYRNFRNRKIGHFRDLSMGKIAIKSFSELDMMTILLGKKKFKVPPERQVLLQVRQAVNSGYLNFFQIKKIFFGYIYNKELLDFQVGENSDGQMIVNCFLRGEENPFGYLFYNENTKEAELKIFEKDNKKKIEEFFKGENVYLEEGEEVICDNVSNIFGNGDIYFGGMYIHVAGRNEGFYEQPVNFRLFINKLGKPMVESSVTINGKKQISNYHFFNRQGQLDSFLSHRESEEPIMSLEEFYVNSFLLGEKIQLSENEVILWKAKRKVLKKGQVGIKLIQHALKVSPPPEQVKPKGEQNNVEFCVFKDPTHGIMMRCAVDGKIGNYYWHDEITKEVKHFLQMKPPSQKMSSIVELDMVRLLKGQEMKTVPIHRTVITRQFLVGGVLKFFGACDGGIQFFEQRSPFNGKHLIFQMDYDDEYGNIINCFTKEKQIGFLYFNEEKSQAEFIPYEDVSKKVPIEQAEKTTGYDIGDPLPRYASDAPAISLVRKGDTWQQYFLTPAQHELINKAIGEMWNDKYRVKEDDWVYYDIQKILRKKGVRNLPINIHSPPYWAFFNVLYRLVEEEKRKNPDFDFPERKTFRLITHPGTYRLGGVPRSYNFFIPEEELQFLKYAKLKYHKEGSFKAYAMWLQHEVTHILDRVSGRERSDKDFNDKKMFKMESFIKAYDLTRIISTEDAMQEVRVSKKVKWENFTKEAIFLIVRELALECGKKPGELSSLDFRQEIKSLGNKTVEDLLLWAKRRFYADNKPMALEKLKSFLSITDLTTDWSEVQLTYKDWERTIGILSKYTKSKDLPESKFSMIADKIEDADIDNLVVDVKTGNEASYEVLWVLARRLYYSTVKLLSVYYNIPQEELKDLPYDMQYKLKYCIANYNKMRGGFRAYLYGSIYNSLRTAYFHRPVSLPFNEPGKLDDKTTNSEKDSNIVLGEFYYTEFISGKNQLEALSRKQLFALLLDKFPKERKKALIFWEIIYGKASYSYVKEEYALTYDEIVELELSMWKKIAEDPVLLVAFTDADFDVYQKIDILLRRQKRLAKLTEILYPLSTIPGIFKYMCESAITIDSPVTINDIAQAAGMEASTLLHPLNRLSNGLGLVVKDTKNGRAEEALYYVPELIRKRYKAILEWLYQFTGENTQPSMETLKHFRADKISPVLGKEQMTAPRPGVSVSNVFYVLVENKIFTPESALTAEEIANMFARNVRSVRTILTSLTKYLKLVSPANPGKKPRKYYVPETVHKTITSSGKDIYEILNQFDKGSFPSTAENSQKVYKEQIAPIMFGSQGETTEVPEQSGRGSSLRTNGLPDNYVIVGEGSKGAGWHCSARPFNTEKPAENKAISLDMVYDYFNKRRATQFRRREMHNTKLLAEEILSRPIERIVIVGGSLPRLCFLLAAEGKEVLFVDRDSALTKLAKAEKARLEEHFGVKLKVEIITFEFSKVNLREQGLNPGTFDLVTMIDLMGPSTAGQPSAWLLKAKELLKGEGYLLIDESVDLLRDRTNMLYRYIVEDTYRFFNEKIYPSLLPHQLQVLFPCNAVLLDGKCFVGTYCSSEGNIISEPNMSENRLYWVLNDDTSKDDTISQKRKSSSTEETVQEFIDSVIDTSYTAANLSTGIEEAEDIIIGIDTSWMPEGQGLQYGLQNLLSAIAKIKNLGKGFNNIRIVRGQGEELATSLIFEVKRTSNVVVLGNAKDMDNEYFTILKEDKRVKRFCFAGVNPVQLNKNKNPIKVVESKILEMLTITLELAFRDAASASIKDMLKILRVSYPGILVVPHGPQGANIFILVPDAEVMNIEVLRERNENAAELISA